MVTTSSIFIFALAFVGSYGGSIHWNEDQLPQALPPKQGEGATILMDYGDEMKNKLLGIIATLPPAVTVASLPVDLTELGASNNIPVRGQLNLTNLAIAGLADLTVPVSSLTINGIFNAIPLHLKFTSPSIKVNTDFEIQGFLANVVPVSGRGKATLDLDFVFEVDAEFKYYFRAQMLMPSLSITLGNFNNLGVIIESDELSQEIIEILQEYTGPLLAQITPGLTKTISENIVTTFDSLKLTFQEFVELIDQIIFGNILEFPAI